MDFAGKTKMSKRKRSSVKVVYISTPMKVKTSASRFRALVQELTGRDSDISRYMDGYDGTTTANAATDFEIVPDQIYRVPKNTVKNGNFHHDHDHDLLSSSFPTLDSRGESPTSSGSLLDHQQSFSTDHQVFVNQFEEQYLKGLFSSNFFRDCSNHELHVLGSYGAM